MTVKVFKCHMGFAPASNAGGARVYLNPDEEYEVEHKQEVPKGIRVSVGLISAFISEDECMKYGNIVNATPKLIPCKEKYLYTLAIKMRMAPGGIIVSREDSLYLADLMDELEKARITISRMKEVMKQVNDG